MPKRSRNSNNSNKSSNGINKKEVMGRSGRRGVIATVAALALVLGCTAAFGFVSAGQDDSADPTSPNAAPSTPPISSEPVPSSGASAPEAAGGDPSSGSPGEGSSPQDSSKPAGSKAWQSAPKKSAPKDSTPKGSAPKNPAPKTKAPSSTPKQDRLQTGLPKSQPKRLVIPAIGVNSKVSVLGLAKDNKSIELPSAPKVPGWYSRSPSPGEIGPAILSGFIRTPKSDGVFANLGKLSKGHRIIVDRGDGKAVVFKVDKIKLYPKGKFVPAEVYSSPRKPLLRIVTVGGTMKPTDKPGNVVVFSHLVSITDVGSTAVTPDPSGSAAPSKAGGAG